MTTTMALLRTVPHGWTAQEAPSGCCAAGAGATGRGSVAPPTASGSGLSTAAALSGFAWRPFFSQKKQRGCAALHLSASRSCCCVCDRDRINARPRTRRPASSTMSIQDIKKVVHRGFAGNGKGNQSFQLWPEAVYMQPSRGQTTPDQDGLVTFGTRFPTNSR